MGRDVTVREMIELVEKDRPYYYRSGGGMTLSGGECLCQPEFARDLLRAAKERGINTAIEKYGLCSLEKYRDGTALSGYLPDGYQAYQSGEA